MIAKVIKIKHSDMVAYQPAIKIGTPYGDITHKLHGVALASRRDAEQAAQEWLLECKRKGFIL